MVPPATSSAPATQPAVGMTPNAQAQPTAEGFQAIIANSVHVVGTNERFAIGLIRDGHSIKDAQAHLKFYDLTSGDPVAKGEADAPFYGDNLGEAGVYVARTAFDKPGSWGVEVSAQEPGKTADVARIGFEVLAQDPSPGIGDVAPRSKNLTLKDVNGDRSKISSASYDDSILHRISIADAVTNGKPTVILFATPAFCTSRTCGPSHQVVMSLAQNYGDKVNFIHVEVYKEFQNFTPADAMGEWRLQTEPWLFFVDKNGKIVDKFEGGITAKEIVPEFLKFIGQN